VAAELKRFIIGRALRTEQAAHERLSKKTALAVFSSDALSSTAYATEEILLVLAAAVAYGQAGAFKYVVPISIGIGVLLQGPGRSIRRRRWSRRQGAGRWSRWRKSAGQNPECARCLPALEPQ